MKLRIALFIIGSITFGSVSADQLFESDETVRFTLDAPLADMRKKRDKEVKYPAKLTHEGKTYNIEVSVRGNKRLQKMTCKNPPLWLDFDKDETDGTLFDKQKHTKLVVLCRSGKVDYDYIRAEYLVYKMHEMLFPASFRTRWAKATYTDGDRTEPAFFIERKQRLGKRIDMDEVDEQHIEKEQLEPYTATLAALFNYIVANPDFSLVSALEGSCCHNSKLFVNDEDVITPVLYDFDSSGIMQTRYAVPNPSLKIKKVTDRIFRGYCMHNDHLEKGRSEVLGMETKWMALINNDPLLSDRYKKKMTKFLNRSFRLIERDATWNSKIVNKCRGKA